MLHFESKLLLFLINTYLFIMCMRVRTCILIYSFVIFRFIILLFFAFISFQVNENALRSVLEAAKVSEKGVDQAIQNNKGNRCVKCVREWLNFEMILLSVFIELFSYLSYLFLSFLRLKNLVFLVMTFEL